MKKLVILVAFSMLFCSCARTKNTIDDGQLSIVTTIFAPYDLARQIAGDKAEVTMLLKPGSESHSFEPTPQDIIRIQNCDLFIYVGGESETWVNDILNSMNDAQFKVVRLMDCVEVVEEEIVEGMEEEEKHGENAEYDEHVWTYPVNVKNIVSDITAALCSIDEANMDYYNISFMDYSSKLDELDEAFTGVTDPARIARNVIVFGDRFPFRYFADGYGLNYYAAFPGCSTETEPSAATLKFLIDKVNQEQIPVVFYIELSNHKIADAICEATGAKALQLHCAHNISAEEFENGATYYDIMKANVDSLKEALG
ncbi:MAG: metal ABC transporter substrate-binding protein [Clostridiales bacterium]|nr:metal ABC transporter substrate-binding protein [Clostridiales bacterium]